MKNKKLLYIHGLSSSGNSSTAKNLAKLLPDVEIIAPDLPINPNEAILLLQEICKSELPDIIMGTSMGGMFAQQIHGYKKILVNPAFHVSEFLRKNIGVQTFLNSRKDGATIYEITNLLCDEYFQLESRQFEGITLFDRENTYALFGEKDELVNCQKEYLQYYEKFDWFSGAHRLMFNNVQEVVVPLVKRILK
jgi:predicted esterase YcpF (UPF0227 family)